MNDKILRTMEMFDSYEKRFAEARASRQLRHPWEEKDKEEIRAKVRELLGFREELIPEIVPETLETLRFDGYDVEVIRYRSWENFFGCMSLYKPSVSDNTPRPLIFILPGHGIPGRKTEGYQRMAQRLVKQGAYVCLSDNIGQGERTAQGHKDCIAPFYCGLNLQVLIQMETIGLIRYFKKMPFVDKTRIAACGNSGGGTETLILTALEPDLAAAASCGYPGDFAYILQKERKHCCCNMLPHFISNLDMWEIYGAFAPKPLLLNQGEQDTLIPVDSYRRNERKVRMCYELEGAAEFFDSKPTKSGHSWTNGDRLEISRFFAKHLGIDAAYEGDDMEWPLCLDIERVYVPLPEGSYTADEMVQEITGIKMPEGTTLADVYPPTFDGKKMNFDELLPLNRDSELHRVFAQYECVL